MRPLARLVALALALAPCVGASDLVVLFTNDVQGHVDPKDLLGDRRAGGVPALWDLLQEEEGRLGGEDDLLLVDSGDFLYGGMRTGPRAGLPMVRIMNALGYDAAALGNHEFDQGPGALRVHSAEAAFPLLTTNLRRSRGGPPPGRFRASTVLTLPRSGVRVGLVGLIGDQLVPTRAGTRNAGVVLEPVERSLERELDRLQGQGAQLVICLTHQGVEADRALARRFAGRIHLILGGHHPTARVDERVAGVPVLQAAADALEVGRVQLPLVEGRPQPRQAAVRWLPWQVREAGPSPFDDLLQRSPTEAAALARTDRAFSLAETAGLVLDAMQAAAAREGLRPTYTFLNRGALRANLPEGPVTQEALYRVAPFDNHLVHLTLPVATLRRLLDDQGEGSPRGSPLLWRGLDPAQLPRRGLVEVVLNDFLADGRDGYPEFLAARARRTLSSTVAEALRAHLEAAGPRLVAPRPVPLRQVRWAKAARRAEPH